MVKYPITLGLLKRRYEECSKNGDEELGIDGIRILTKFAKYLIMNIEDGEGVTDDTILLLESKEESE